MNFSWQDRYVIKQISVKNIEGNHILESIHPILILTLGSDQNIISHYDYNTKQERDEDNENCQISDFLLIYYSLSIMRIDVLNLGTERVKRRM